MIARPLCSGILTAPVPAHDTWGDPFAIFTPPPARSGVSCCRSCGTEMIAGPGCALPEVCSACEVRR